MKLRIRHTTICSYDAPPSRAALVLRLRPRDLPYQRVHDFTLRTAGLSARQTESGDHFGNIVSRLFIAAPAAELELVAESVLDMRPRPSAPDPAFTPAWERIAQAASRASPDIAEFAFASPLTPHSPLVRAWTSISFPPGRPVLAGVTDLLARARQGPQMDVPTHRVLAGLRALQLPARIVSGYVPAGELGLWLACWLGPEWGWLDLDAATGTVVGEDHISLGWGRDAMDVSPVWSIPRSTSVHRVAIDRDAAEQSAALLPAVGGAR